MSEHPSTLPLLQRTLQWALYRALVPGFFVVSLGAAAQAQELTLEQVLEKHLEARGGKAALQALTGYEATGTVHVSGFEMPFVLQRARPDRFKLEMEMQGSKIVNAYDGETAWGLNPLAEQSEPQLIEDPRRVSDTKRQGVFDGLLLGHQVLGATLELKGSRELDGREVLEIAGTLADDTGFTVFLDSSTFLEVRQMQAAVVDGMGEVEVSLDYGEFVEVAGVKLPKNYTTATPMSTLEFVFDEYRPNPDLDEAAFGLPGQIADASLDLKQILSRHDAARRQTGHDQIQSLTAGGTVLFQGFEVPMTMKFLRPNLFRVDVDLQGMEMTQAFDGMTAWTVSPLQGITEPEELGPEAAAAVAVFSDFLWGLLAEPEDRGLTLQFVGIETVDRNETYKLLVSSGGQATRYEVFLGGEDFMEQKISLQAEFMGQDQTLIGKLANFENVSGLMLPTRIALEGAGLQLEMKIAELEANVALKPADFAMPQPVAEAGSDQP